MILAGVFILGFPFGDCTRDCVLMLSDLAPPLLRRPAGWDGRPADACRPSHGLIFTQRQNLGRVTFATYGKQSFERVVVPLGYLCVKVFSIVEGPILPIRNEHQGS